MAGSIPFESVPPLLARLRGASVDLRILTAVASVDPGEVTVYDPYRLAARRGFQESTLRADLTVLVGPTAGDDRLVGELDGLVGEVHAIGDCVSPRRITHAVLEGHRIGRRL